MSDSQAAAAPPEPAKVQPRGGVSTATFRLGWFGMDTFLVIVAAVAPICVVMGLGYGLGRGGILSKAGEDSLTQLLFYVLLPAQLFLTIGKSQVAMATNGPAMLAAALGFVATMLLMWSLTRGLAPAQRGSAVSGSARANGAFVGLPVVILLGNTLPQGGALAAAYGVLLAIMVPLFNVGSVLAFILSQRGASWSGLTAALAHLPGNPLILACFGGLIVAWFWPGLLQEAPGMMRFFVVILDILGLASIGLALLLTGSRLDVSLLRHDGGLLAGCTATKLLLAPALTCAVGWLLGADPHALTAAVLLNACPSAMAAVAMARSLGGDDRLLAGIIVATTVACPLTVTAWVWLSTVIVPR